MRLVFLGPPGAGKGTQSKLLVERFGLRQVSTGDLFRAALKSKTAVGIEAQRFMDEGELVPDDVVNRIVEEALEEVGPHDFILDGFPRTIPQAAWLLDYLDQHDAPLDAVISMRIDEEVVIRRLSRRRMDPATGAIYHLDFKPPPPDIPGERLVQRRDDEPEAIRNRLRVYEAQTRPIKAFLAEHVYVLEIDGYGEIEDVQQRILDGLEASSVSSKRLAGDAS